jgi:hypothetical protein
MGSLKRGGGDKPEWYEEIRKELAYRDKQCKKRDPNDVYKRGDANPYRYGSLAAFKNENPFKSTTPKYCKYKSPNEVDIGKDPYGRFYKNITHEEDCKKVYGKNDIWDPASVNRKYRYEDGVCWANKEAAHCAKYEPKELLRHAHDPDAKINRDVLMAQGAKKCSADPKCAWVKMKVGADCFDKGTADKLMKRTSTPPAEMPADITGNKPGIEQFLYDFYAKGEVLDPASHAMKIRKQVIAPAFTPLEGDGNRCARPQKGGYIIEQPDEINAFGMPVVRKQVKRLKIPDGEEKVDTGEDDKPAMLPSLSQSVINMVMKNWSIKEDKGERVTNRGLLAWHSTGSGKCHAKDTPILMYDGSVKMVQDVVVGDLIMGDDSTPRQVLALGQGEDDMYDIIPTKGEKYTVNSEHILVLRHTVKEAVTYIPRQKNMPFKASYLDKSSMKLKAKSFASKEEAKQFMATFTDEDRTIEIEVKDFLNLPKYLQRNLKGYRTGVSFASKDVAFDPYVMGYWLGDGSKRDPVISTQESSVLAYLRKVLPSYNLSLNFQSGYDYRISSSVPRGDNVMLQTLQRYGMINNKHIPMDYKTNDRYVRMKLLAGLIDSDGYYGANCYDIIQKNSTLAQDIVYLCRSLGFAAYSRVCTKSCMYRGQKVEGEYHRISISGHGLEEIPCLVPRKRAHVRNQLKDPLVTGIRVDHVGHGRYYGFTLDSNHRYLIGDFTVTHNTCTAAGVMDAFYKSKRDIIFASSLDALASNPPSNFYECLYNLYPDWQKGEFEGMSKDETVRRIGEAFERRGVRYLSFAKLSNRVKKTVESGALRRSGGAKKGVVVADPRKKVVQGTKMALEQKKKAKAQQQRRRGHDGDDVPRKKRAVERAVGAVSRDDFIDLNNTVLIVDEVHNLFRPLPTQRIQHDYLKGQLLDPTKWPGLKMVILSATPGDSVDDVLMLLNMIRDPTHPTIRAPVLTDQSSVNRFKDDVRGLISYFDMSSDRTRFPVVKDNEPEIMPMDPGHFEKYMEAYLKTIKEKKTTDYAKLAKDNMLNKYWSPARKYSNMLYTFEKGMKASEFSSKLPALLEKIRGYEHEKHYVYSAFYDNRNKGWSSQGILAIGNMIEKELGYKKFSMDMAQFDKNGNVTRMPEKGKRFLVVTLKELGGDGGDGKLSSSAGDRLKKMLKVYNHPDNRYGEYIHVMLASNAFNEGIDLKSVRHIHFFEPLVTMASDKQTIGRAARFCSHADLDKDKGEWTVEIHRYMSHYPLNIQLRTSKSGAQAAKIVEEATGPTEDEKDRMARFEDRVRETRGVLEGVVRELEGLKGLAKGDVAAKAKVVELKVREKALKVDIKENEAAIKAVKKGVEEREKLAKKSSTGSTGTRRKKGTALTSVDTDSVKMIDEFIFQESRERVKELLVVYQSMKEAAVDCRLLQRFHAVGNNQYGCEKWEQRARDAAAAQAVPVGQERKGWPEGREVKFLSHYR